MAMPQQCGALEVVDTYNGVTAELVELGDPRADQAACSGN